MSQWNLFTLCAVEVLERFAFYGTLAVLLIFLTQGRGMEDRAAESFFGSFVGLVFLAPLVGGILADRVLGQARAVIVGTALLALGYALLLFHGNGTLYAGFFALLAGQGFFKPAIAAGFANRYPRLDSRRETAFITFFIVIQLGSLIGGLASSAVERIKGVDGSFALAAAAMTIALLMLLSWRRSPSQAPPLPKAAAQPPLRWSALLTIYLLCMLNSLAASVLTLSLPFFMRAHVDLSLGGRFEHPIRASWLHASEWAFQLLLALLVIIGLFYLRRRRIELTGLAKVGIGMVLTALPCLLMLRASMGAASGHPVSMFWVLGSYLAAALPFVFMTPIVMALVSQLVPPRHLCTVFATWFVLSSFLHRGAGRLMAMQSVVPEPLWYGGLGLISLIAAGLWVSQVRRLEAGLRCGTRSPLSPAAGDRVGCQPPH